VGGLGFGRDAGLAETLVFRQLRGVRVEKRNLGAEKKELKEGKKVAEGERKIAE
jgi:hypothetical protein